MELVAGGLRNVYDLAFTPEGELFVHDSDMESDMGTTWYRPTQLLHVVPGGEYGWRSGWAKYPEYYYDGLPAAAKTGRGSPTGITCYQHHAFPLRFQGALFLADWSEGRILVARPKLQGATYVAETEVFMTGTPLNICDMDVGPDGALYFVTGGRDTHGGLYRVSWKGDVPAEFKQPGEGVAAAIKQPQLHAAWGRQSVANLKQAMGDKWAAQVRSVAESSKNSVANRIRALELMQLLGPQPDQELLKRLAADPAPALRAKAAEVLGLRGEPDARGMMIEMLSDKQPLVRRKAAEGLVRGRQTASLERLAPMLASLDRFESWAARRLLERLPPAQWREDVFGA